MPSGSSPPPSSKPPRDDALEEVTEAASPPEPNARAAPSGVRARVSSRRPEVPQRPQGAPATRLPFSFPQERAGEEEHEPTSVAGPPEESEERSVVARVALPDAPTRRRRARLVAVLGAFALAVLMAALTWARFLAPGPAPAPVARAQAPVVEQEALPPEPEEASEMEEPEPEEPLEEPAQAGGAGAVVAKPAPAPEPKRAVGAGPVSAKPAPAPAPPPHVAARPAVAPPAPAEDDVRDSEESAEEDALSPEAAYTLPLWPEPRGSPPAEGGVGELTLITLPTARVQKDGSELGTTPLRGAQFPSGRHELVLTGPDDLPRRFVVDVKSGGHTRVQLPLRRLRPIE